MASRVNILALDTSASACSIALSQGGKTYFLEQIAPMQQAKLILPMIQQLLNNASLTLNQLDGIAFGGGPGSFTGTRIASSVAQGLGFALNIPIVRISSLAILAQTCFLEKNGDRVLIALDARNQHIYWAIYQLNQQLHMELIGNEQICLPHQLPLPAGIDKNTPWVGVGDAWETYGEIISQSLGWRPQSIYSSLFPSAKALLQLAQDKLEKGESIAASCASPVYLR